jgi:hypothetical protein
VKQRQGHVGHEGGLVLFGCVDLLLLLVVPRGLQQAQQVLIPVTPQQQSGEMRGSTDDDGRDAVVRWPVAHERGVERSKQQLVTRK